MKLQLRRDLDINWMGKILLPGEPGFATDTGILKIGDTLGTPWENLQGISGGGSDYELELLGEFGLANCAIYDYMNRVFSELETDDEKFNFFQNASLELAVEIPEHDETETKGYFYELVYHPKGSISEACAMTTWGSFFVNDPIIADYNNNGAWHNGGHYTYAIPGIEKAGQHINSGGGVYETRYGEFGNQDVMRIDDNFLSPYKLSLNCHIEFKNGAAYMEYEDACIGKLRANVDDTWKDFLVSRTFGYTVENNLQTEDKLKTLYFIFYPSEMKVSDIWGFSSLAYTTPEYLLNPAKWNEFSLKVYRKI